MESRRIRKRKHRVGAYNLDCAIETMEVALKILNSVRD